MFTVGQKVWDVLCGEGEVVEVKTHDCRYPVVAEFGGGFRESYTRGGKKNEALKNPSLYTYPVEIVKKVTKPSINWEHVREDFKYLAKTIDGDAWLFSEKPVLGVCGWDVTRGECAEAQQFASYVPGTCDWKDSLVERP